MPNRNSQSYPKICEIGLYSSIWSPFQLLLILLIIIIIIKYHNAFSNILKRKCHPLFRHNYRYITFSTNIIIFKALKKQ